jgi:hypothetical protein
MFIYSNIAMSNNKLRGFRSFYLYIPFVLIVFDLLPWDPTCLFVMSMLSIMDTVKIMIVPTPLAFEILLSTSSLLPPRWPQKELCPNPRQPNVGVEI